MQAKRKEHHQQDGARRDYAAKSGKLDERYGEIGIPAVAAAVRCRAEEPKSDRGGYRPRDYD